MSKQPIYLDYNATTPLDRRVIEVMRPYLDQHFGNPSSSHFYGRVARAAVEKARTQVASVLNCVPEEIVFTGGGTEANNYAIRGVALARRGKGNHIITSQIEHAAVTNVCNRLQADGFEITYVPVDEHGCVGVAEVAKALRPETILITLMHANNEVGTIQPIEDVARLAKSRAIVFHTDAAQSVGKIATDVKALGVDLLSIAGHKLYAPKGVGALYIREGLEVDLLMQGGGQEGGRRPGTENVLEIVGLGEACAIAGESLASLRAHMERMRERLVAGLLERVPRVRVNGHPTNRLPNTLSLSVEGVDASAVLSEIDEQVAASAGSACHSGQVHISPVLKAMNVPDEWARGTLRFSTGRLTTGADIDAAVTTIAGAVKELRASRTEGQPR